MAQTLCQLKKKGGGKMAETILWTNSAPTSNMGATTITLSQGLSNFKYLKIEFNYGTASSSILYDSGLFPTDAFKNVTEAAAKQALLLARNDGSMAGRIYARSIKYISDTSIRVSIPYILNESSSLQNNVLIPTKIIGVA